MKTLQCLFWIFIFFVINSIGFAQNQGFTQEDRERMIRTEVTLKNFMENVDNRFESINTRFEDMNKRIDKTDKTISNLREDMNKTISNLREDMNKRVSELRGDSNLLFNSLINMLDGLWDLFLP